MPNKKAGHEDSLGERHQNPPDGGGKSKKNIDNRDSPESISTQPFSVLLLAIKAVPSLKYGLGIAGLVAATSLSISLVRNIWEALIGPVALIILMVVLWLFSKLTAAKSSQVRYAGFTLMWFALLAFIVSSVLLMSSAFFEWPRRMTEITPVNKNNSKEDLYPRLAFEQIEIATNKCLWRPIRRPCETEAKIKNFAGKNWNFGGPPKGEPRDLWQMGSHQLSPRDPEAIKSGRSLNLDPVFDLVIVNKSSGPSVVSKIGFRPVAAWTSPKGPAFAGRLGITDSISIDVAGFEVGVDQWLQLHDPIFMEPGAPYRFDLCLNRYCQQVGRNESAIRLLLEAGGETFASPEIYLGHFSPG